MIEPGLRIRMFFEGRIRTQFFFCTIGYSTRIRLFSLCSDPLPCLDYQDNNINYIDFHNERSGQIRTRFLGSRFRIIFFWDVESSSWCLGVGSGALCFGCRLRILFFWDVPDPFLLELGSNTGPLNNKTYPQILEWY